MDLGFFYLLICGFAIAIGAFCLVFGIASKKSYQKYFLIFVGLIFWIIVVILFVKMRTLLI
ncbi:hypothetical protein [Lactobacillus psittaci]|uniref:hypothetical protein n=1 Tax=Lactobacillus psittaci TaxID=116089 RepID=UPI000484499D|nr:hypothetical protein [Lactobacillus psittaci]